MSADKPTGSKPVKNAGSSSKAPDVNNEIKDTDDSALQNSAGAGTVSADVSQSQAAELKVEENKIKIISPGQMVLKRFFRSKLSVIGLVTLIILFAFSFLGPLIPANREGGKPWGETEADEARGSTVVMDDPTNFAEKVQSDTGYIDVFYSVLTSADGFVAFNEDDDESDKQKKITGNLDILYQKFTTEGVLECKPNSNTVYLEETIYITLEKEQNKITIFIVEKNEDGNFSRIYHDIIKRTVSIRERNLSASPSLKHFLGTDKNGYDIFTRLMYAGRISLTLGFVVIFIETFLGILFGGLAGYFGKWVDNIIMRVIDILYCLPNLPILLIFSAILESMEIEEGLKIYILMGMLSIIGWAGIARTVRGQILFLREQEFMVAAEALGIGVPRRIIKHLVPNVMPLLIVQMTLGLGSVILTESTLSYLGLGIKPPAAAWGTMINSANDPLILQFYPNQWVPAGVMIVLAVLAFNFVGDGLRDAFDPKMRR